MDAVEGNDPRPQRAQDAIDPLDPRVTPVVRLPGQGVPTYVMVGVAVLFGLLLFSVLNARRNAQPEPAVRARKADAGSTQFQPPPPLYIPPEPVILTRAAEPVPLPVLPPVPSTPPRPTQLQFVPSPQPIYQPVQMQPSIPPAPPPRTSAGAPLVVDVSMAPNAPGQGGRPDVTGAAALGQSTSRMRASAFANRSMTVPQGHLIRAVLETAFDSTKAGFARAIISQDIRGFDGKEILIPRGSRLIGEYRSEVGQGQKRAAIIWTRLMRPDGMTIALDSPAVDPLGRGGVKASVNTHFWARLGDAFLQSSFEIGRTLADRAVTGPVVVISGNTAGAASQAVPTTNYVPTLVVPAGKSISVFVAHDLDFSAVGAGR